MTFEDAVAIRMNSLVDDSITLSRINADGQAYDERQLQQCAGWLTSALNLVQVLCPNESNAFRKHAEKIAAR